MLGDQHGFAVETLALDGGARPWSSTAVRQSLADGDVSGAAEILGRPHTVTGVVLEGDHRGRELGYPTANVESPAHTAVPADGVYAGRLVRSGGELVAAISVGTNPTFSGEQRRVEAFVLDFDGDLYGEHVGVDFVHRLRPMLAFDTVAALLSAMDDDVRRTRELLPLSGSR